MASRRRTRVVSKVHEQEGAQRALDKLQRILAAHEFNSAQALLRGKRPSYVVNVFDGGTKRQQGTPYRGRTLEDAIATVPGFEE